MEAFLYNHSKVAGNIRVSLKIIGLARLQPFVYRKIPGVLVLSITITLVVFTAKTVAVRVEKTRRGPHAVVPEHVAVFGIQAIVITVFRAAGLEAVKTVLLGCEAE